MLYAIMLDMERSPEHLTEDPHLRPNFVDQMSWDEWAAEHTPFFLIPEGRALVEIIMREKGMEATYEDAIELALGQWRSTLRPETSINETMYLEGYTYAQRWHVIEQQHAELVRRAVELGVIEERQVDKEFRQNFGE